MALTAAGAALAASTDFIEPATSTEFAGSSPTAIAAADLDGDADQDLAVVNEGDDNVTILLSKGNGDFFERATSPEAVGITPTSVAAADLDGDGDQDLAVTAFLSSRVTILRNTGLGNFVEPASSPEFVPDDPIWLDAADLDGDGDQDLAVANRDDNTVEILRNNGSGNFFLLPSASEPAGFSPTSVAAADLDGDADQDLAVANFNTDEVTILRNNGNGGFGQPASSPEATGDGPVWVTAADLDGDGDQDLAVPNVQSAPLAGAPDDVTILLNKGNGDFVEPAASPEPVGDRPNSIAAADFDADGDQDLAVANSFSSDMTILRNNGNGGFGEPASSPEATGLAPIAVVAATLDGDADPDLAAANANSGSVTILLNR